MLITKARAGDSAAQYEIACILASGQLGVIDHKVSFHWFMKAALKGHIEAMWNAGLQLVLGLGVEMDADAGLHLIDLAASRNCYDAICYLAHTYHLGLHGVSIDREKSGYLYRLAKSVEPWHQVPHLNLNQQRFPKQSRTVTAPAMAGVPDSTQIASAPPCHPGSNAADARHPPGGRTPGP
jgi:hypothetical protein